VKAIRSRKVGSAVRARPGRAIVWGAALLTTATAGGGVVAGSADASAGARLSPAAEAGSCSLVAPSAVAKVIGHPVLLPTTQTQHVTIDSQRDVSADQTACRFDLAHSGSFVAFVFETLSKPLPLGVLWQDLKASALASLPSRAKYKSSPLKGLSVPAYIVRESGPGIAVSAIIALNGEKVCGPELPWSAPANELASLARLAISKFM